MRLFVAIPIGDDIREALGRFRTELSGRDETVRWVASHLLHITLKFLGETSEGDVAGIQTALETVRCQPFDITVCGLGFFPNERAARVFWAGLEAEPLPSLVDAVEASLRPLGVPAEPRPFRPHLTIARSRQDRPMSRAFQTATEGARGRVWGRFRAEEFSLYRSELQSTGPRYTVLRSYPLG